MKTRLATAASDTLLTACVVLAFVLVLLVLPQMVQEWF